MNRFFGIFLNEDGGQDLIEYTLLLAFVALGSAGLFLGSGANVDQVWSSANSVLTAATGSQSPPSNSGGGSQGGGSQGGGDQGGGDQGGGHGGGEHGGDGGRH